jgi:predicted  nucleic acid-binding Zn-ribbon protein
MSAIFNSNKAAGSSIRRQRTRNASAQFRARQEGMIDEGKHCGKCGDYYPSISTEWERWICDDCGGNVVRGSHKVVNAGSEQPAPGAERRARFARVRNKQKAPRSTFLVSSFLDKPDRPKPVKKVTPKKAKVAAKSAKELKREAAMKTLGLTEADIIKFNGGN